MTGLEKIRWAKALIEEESGGRYQFVVGNVHDDLYLRCGDKANVGLYLTVQQNEKQAATTAFSRDIPASAVATTTPKECRSWLASTSRQHIFSKKWRSPTSL